MGEAPLSLMTWNWQQPDRPNFKRGCARTLTSSRLPRTIVALAIVFVTAAAGRADDSAAGVAAGGIRLVRQTGISMRREVLRIGLDQVTAAYDFENLTDHTITTDVAFPLPITSAETVQSSGVVPGVLFDARTFRFRVNGKAVPYTTATRAMLDGKDYEPELRRLGIDAATYAGIATAEDTTVDPAPQIAALPAAVRQRLQRENLIDDDGVPRWTAEVIYYWRQVFPPHQIVHIRHEYKPAYGAQWDLGHSFFKTLAADPLAAGRLARFGNACVDRSLARLMSRQSVGVPDGGRGAVRWVDFILTTANNWRRPIGDFHLEIDTPNISWGNPTDGDNAGDREYLSLCWPAPITKVAPGKFVSNVTGFVPTSNLHVVFFRVPGAKGRSAP
jgi:hypothetical protein